jgi:hypothetical protein
VKYSDFLVAFGVGGNFGGEHASLRIVLNWAWDAPIWHIALDEDPICGPRLGGLLPFG